jgi:hypothetical protein
MASYFPNRVDETPPGKLWFGFAATAVAWVALSAGDVFITWWACLEDRPFGGSAIRMSAVALYFVATILLIGAAIAAGVVSYRNWRRLSGKIRLLDAEGNGRREFMALLGIFVSFTLGIGLVWMTIPLFILSICVRAR